MLNKLMPWLLISMTAIACSEKEDDDPIEEEDTGTPPPPPPSGLSVDGLYFENWVGYVGGTPVSSDGSCSDDTLTTQTDCEAASGTWTAGADHVTLSDSLPSANFSIVLLDSVKQDYCLVSWNFTKDDLVEDEALLSGSVPDAFDDGVDNVSWWGYIIEGVTPTTGGTCDNWDDEFSQSIFDALMQQETPGFGFGPPTDDMDEALQNAANTDYDSAKLYAFTGFMSLTILDQNGAREYFDLNASYAYQITDGATDWSPQGSNYPQGGEIEHESASFTDGFYVGRPVMQIGWQPQ